MSESNSEDEEGMVVRSTLLDLRKRVESPGFILQCKAAFPYFTLLDEVITYLYHPMPCPPRCLPEDCPIIIGSVEARMKEATSLLAGLNASSAAGSGVTTTSDVYAAACVHCRESAHMPFKLFQSIKDEKGAEWLPHYTMLCGASAGCVETVKTYHYHGGSVVGGKQLTIWDGSKNNSSYNAYRATFENQSAATILRQEATRAFMKTLPGARRIIADMERQMRKKNKLLQCRDRLLESVAANSASRGAAGSAASEVVPQFRRGDSRTFAS